jgi:glycosyltransferase involved in cell wall biosynthesis
MVNRLLFWPPVLQRIRAFTEGQRTLLAIGKPSDLALAALGQLPHLTSLYDAMDDFPAFHDGIARIACARIESEINQRVTLRSTSSSHIANRMRDAAGGNVSLIPNGVAASRLPAFRRRRDSGESRNFGYVGTIGPWFDWNWIAKLAQDWPERRVEIHGPLYQPPPADLPANVTLGPALPHDQAITLMAEFAAGLIPFRATALTESVDPVKFYEYRALGLPVISAPFGEMRQHGTQPRVLLAEDPAAVHDGIAALLAEHDTAESVADFRRRNDWSARFEPLAEALDTMP